MPQVLLLYLSDDDRRLQIVENMFNHLYLSHCVTDLLVRMLTISELPSCVQEQEYHTFRLDILQHCINNLETHSGDPFMTSQIFDVLSGVVRKCYNMCLPHKFFEELMSPFLFMPLLQFTFEGG